ncbi:MAG TPA: acetylxylan esterase [Lacipirellulaceae bacterium]|jgi:dienelactone hydrolase|nr:acetylxylan esterase [Lacipirellulaceae bacterium]
MRFAREILVGTVIATTLLSMASPANGLDPSADTSRGERMIAAYFKSETDKLANAYLAEIETLEDWTARRDTYRRQLQEMLGLDPLPERTPLNAVITGTLDHPEFVVEKLHFQSRPQLYVTANLYLPKNRSGPLPAILYVCGHSAAKENGVSYGNKTKCQHHAAWFARHGYVCLVIDTLQLGEIEGIHHGTYRENMWWWNARGYTPAGVEAWNAIRSLDYLQSRPEVDGERLGVTGRSGGGAYSWWLAALDDRVKAAVPVAGITSLENHVVDGCVEGHCDCMYLVNTYRWDYAQVAALVAPRPLLLANSDRDEIFPLDGVLSVHEKLTRLYNLHGHPERLGLNITAGGHDDTQPLQVHAFQWFDQHLKGQTETIAAAAEPIFEIEQLKVFDELPSDEINSRVHETFVPQAPTPPMPASADEWSRQADRWRELLLQKCFRGWPEPGGENGPPAMRKLFQSGSAGVRLSAYDFDSQDDVTLRLYVLAPADAVAAKVDAVELHLLDEAGWLKFLSAMRVAFSDQFDQEAAAEPDEAEYARLQLAIGAPKRAIAFLAPRGIGPTAWNPEKETHIRRRFMLLGQTLDGMRLWDTRRAVQAVRTIDGFENTPLELHANGDMAGIALYAALFEPPIRRLELTRLAQSHRDGPEFLNVLRVLDLPQTVAMVAENSQLVIRQEDGDDWEYPGAVADKLGWKNQLTVELEDRKH